MIRTVSFTILFSFIFTTNVFASAPVNCPQGKMCTAIELDGCQVTKAFTGICAENKCKVGTTNYVFPNFYLVGDIGGQNDFPCGEIGDSLLSCINGKNEFCCENEATVGFWNGYCMQLYCECVKELAPVCECTNMECGIKACGKDCGACPSGYTCEKGLCNKGNSSVDDSICPSGEKCFAVTVDDSCLVDTANQGVCANGSCYAKSKYVPYPYFYVTDKSVNAQENFDCSFLSAGEISCVEKKNSACCDGNLLDAYWSNDCMEAFCQCDGGLDCGGCDPGYTCKAGACEKTCTPNCTNKDCGNNGCGGSCGNCPDGKSCTNNKCLDKCTPKCSGKQCGSNGCGGSCGNCLSGTKCSEGKCVPTCTASCNGKECGDNGCGGSCGTCPSNKQCNSSSKCVANCQPQCSTLQECGPDGCGGTCGTCPSGAVCDKGGCHMNECNSGDKGCTEFGNRWLCKKDGGYYIKVTYPYCEDPCDPSTGECSNCHDECPYETEEFCSGKWLYECYMDKDTGCFIKEKEQKCKAGCKNGKCLDDSCNDECGNVGESWWNGLVVKQCVEDSDGCYVIEETYCPDGCSVDGDEYGYPFGDSTDSQSDDEQSNDETTVDESESDDDEESSETEAVVFVFDEDGNIHLVDEEGNLEFCDPELGVMKFNLEAFSKKRQEQALGKNCSISIQETSASNKPLLILMCFLLFVIFSGKRVKQ